MSDTKTPEQIAAEILAKAKGKPNGKVKPEPVERGQGNALLKAVREFLGRFVAYPSDHAKTAHVLWCAYAHLMDSWESTPRLAFLSPEPASGKTRALEITELLVPNPVSAVNVSVSYLSGRSARKKARQFYLMKSIRCLARRRKRTKRFAVF